MDRLLDEVLDEVRSGPSYLRQSAIAALVVEAIQYNAAKLEHYGSMLNAHADAGVL